MSWLTNKGLILKVLHYISYIFQWQTSLGLPSGQCWMVAICLFFEKSPSTADVVLTLSVNLCWDCFPVSLSGWRSQQWVILNHSTQRSQSRGHVHQSQNTQQRSKATAGGSLQCHGVAGAISDGVCVCLCATENMSQTESLQVVG